MAMRIKEMLMTSLIEPLIPLQDLDLRIHGCKVRRDGKPKELAGFQGKVDRAASNLEVLRLETRTLQKDADDREQQVREFDDKIDKLTTQSNMARKNDEYHAYLKEISGIKADKSRVEDSLLDIFMQLDEKKKLEKIRMDEVALAESKHAEAKTRIEGEMAKVDREIEQLLDERRGRQRAARLGLRVTGVLGVLVEAKHQHLLAAVRPVLDALRNEAGFWISDDLYRSVLDLAGEAS